MSGTINFVNYPVSNRVPGTYAEFDPSNANSALVNQRTLIIGQTFPAQATTPIAVGDYGKPVLSVSPTRAAALYGTGSVLASMVEWYAAQDSFATVWELPIADPTGATAAAGSIGITGTATSGGTLYLMIGGEEVDVPVSAGDAAAVVLANTAASLVPTLAPKVPVTAGAVAAGALPLTAKVTGAIGNGIDIRLNYYGAAQGQSTPPGLTVTITPMAGGAGVPTTNLVNALATLAGQQFDFIVLPYNDTATLNAMDTFLNETTGRWSWMQQLYGGYFTCVQGTSGALNTAGTARNGPRGTAIGVYDSPDTLWNIAADYAGVCARSLKADPGLPLQYMQLNFKAPPPASRFSIGIRNTMLYSGISTFLVNDAGQCILERAVTFYQTNLAGQPDNSYLDVEVDYSLMLLARDMRQYLQSKFMRKKLVSDGNRVPPGSNLVTPSLIRTAAIARYRRQCDAGNAQNPDDFAANIVAENAGNGLVKMTWPFVLVSQLRQIVASVNFQRT